MSLRPHLIVVAALAIALSGLGCKSPAVRVMSADEPVATDPEKAGAETFNALTVQCVNKLLDKHAEGDQRGRKKVCFVELENLSAEELGANREALYQQI